MFLKPFRVKNKSALKGSDRKRLKSILSDQIPGLSEDFLSQLMKQKENITQMKALTHKGVQVLVYFFDKNPAFIEIDQIIYPTVYTLWKKPNLLTTFTTWPLVFDKLFNGADLMLPGVVLRSGDISCERLGNVKVNEPCAIKLVGSLTPIAVCRSMLSGNEVSTEGRKGKAAELIHIHGDLLWELGDKSSPPVIPEPVDLVMQDVGDVENDLEMQAETDVKNDGEAGELKMDDDATIEDESPEKIEENKPDEVSEVTSGISDLVVAEPSNSATLENAPYDTEAEMSKKTPLEEMDELLWNCLLVALKTNAKRLELPCPTSTFYRKHVLAAGSQAKNVDIKKTSYKKLSNFLRAAEKEGILQVKELSKGVESIVNINYMHERVKCFKVKIEDVEEVTDSIPAVAEEEFPPPPTLRELFVVSAASVPFFANVNMKKGTPLSAKNVRDIITDYVKKNELNSKENKRLVILDPILCQCFANKDNVDSLTWEELHQRCLSKMQPAHEITFPGKEPIIRKGPIESIEVVIAQRGANKKVTLITYLEKFGIDPSKFAHQLQTGVAASTSVSMNTDKKSQQVLVQGNQVKFVAKLLLEKYQIPKKYVKGLEIAAKKK